MLTSKLFKRVIFNALSFSKSTVHNLSFSVCLVGMILREMKKEEEKIGEKMVGSGVWLEGEKGRENGRAGYFLSGPPKHDLCKLRRNARENK